MNDRLQILIYDVVGDPWEGTSARQVVDQLMDHPGAREIEVFINSVGGDVFQGTAIYSALARHQARVTTHVDGLAASIASVIVQAGDERTLSRGATMMIHEPWVLAVGDSDTMEAASRMLEVVRDGLVDIYETRSGQQRSQIEAWMRQETWWSASEAVAHGFADRIAERAIDALAETAMNRFGVEMTAPQALRAALSAGQTVQPAFALHADKRIYVFNQATRKPKAETMSQNNDNFITRLWNRALGQEGAPADELDVLDEVRQVQARAEALGGQVQTLQAQNAQLTTEVEQLRARVAEAEEAAEEEAEADMEALLDTAVAEFRIRAADRDHWREQLGADGEAARRALAALPENAFKPKGAEKGPAAPTGAPITITSEAARSTKAYREAKARAAEAGVELVILPAKEAA